MRILTMAAAALITFGVAAETADAHTISMGSFNAGAPGSVSIAMGTYAHGAGIFQGGIQLIAGPGIPPFIPAVPAPFTAVTLVKPTGLVDGDNNFYADAVGGLPSDSFNQAANTVGLGSVVNWQVATFTGLSAGLYTYQLTGMTSANWTNVNSFENNWTGTIFIPKTSVNTNVVPEPGTFALFGLAAVGAYVVRRRRKTS